ncbi:HNH endonuclease [Streptomyces sp. NPDC007872]|uniref:HNH endonuclease n=1 Tax=Streptomyces sp. NPDC007872 TaxID=3364782 RepID=UPI003679B286
MRPIDKPVLDARTVFDTCTATARPKTVRTKLQALKDTVAAAAAEYDTAATARALHTLGHLKDLPDGEPKKKGGLNKELKNTYSSRMVHKKSAGRDFYDQLLKEAPDDRCALCGQGIADTLDHQLPKAHYPLLAVAPANLVPACRDCNYYKGEEAPLNAEQQTLHPYYDGEIHDHTWLVARVSGPPKPAVVFAAVPPPEMPSLLAARVRHHFTILKLARLYNPQAGPELRNLSRSLPRLSAKAVLEHLRERAEDWAVSEGVNSWQAALYRALANSPWYTGGGYKEPWK